MNKRARSRKGSPQLREYLVIGKNSVAELLRYSGDRVREIYVESDAAEDVIRELTPASLRIPTKKLARTELDKRCGSTSHQGVVALCSKPPFSELSAKEFFSQQVKHQTSVIVALDGVSDPQNLGSVLRAAECFGAHAVLFPKDRGALVTPTVTKVSAGASEVVPWYAVSNLADWLQHAKDSGYWIVATTVGEEAQDLFAFDWPEKSIIVMGAEGKGIRLLTAKRADFFVTIPMSGRVDSLNISQAAAVVLASYRAKFAHSEE